MKRNVRLLHLILCSLFVFGLDAQSNYSVLLHTGNTTFPENAKDYADNTIINSAEIIEGKFYRIIQFYEIPNNAALTNIANYGIDLLEYIPHNAYVAAIPEYLDLALLNDLNVRSIMPISSYLKVADNLKGNYLPEHIVFGDWIDVMLKFHKNIPHENIRAFAKADDIRVVMDNGINNFLRAQIRIDAINDIAALPYVAFLEAGPEPSVPDDDNGRSLHRANMLDTQVPNGRHYDGSGITVMTRDDGKVGPHIDYQGRIDNSTALNVLVSRTHGDGVSGIFAGAGNLDPTMRGMAAGADIIITDYEPTFLDSTLKFHLEKDVLITNSSYSNGCNAGYTTITETVDQQCFENNTFLHVFSAGNSNAQDCEYGAGPNWATITGGHKQGKNVMATANLEADGTLVGSSSWGPAHDGRLKPDIAAHGTQMSTAPENAYMQFGGTSGAAPNIAGITAQLQQAYVEKNGDLAEASLLKAVMMNTANDLGNTGPDYKFGWGHVNSYRAALTIEEDRFSKYSVEPDVNNTHVLSIPSNVVEARIMVYWADQPGTVMTNKSLVNDLNCWVSAPDGTDYHPWVLDPTPNDVNLNTPEINGTDTLNNVEQVFITNPPAGDYTVNVEGFELPFGTHDYYLVWEFRSSTQEITYPNGGEHFAPGETIRIHWDAATTNGFYAIWYSVNGGLNWTPINTVFGEERMMEWIIPEETTPNARVRVTKTPGNISSISQFDFSIAPRPENVTIAEVCPDHVKLVWDPVVDAAAYDVFVLGEKYMDSVATTSSTIYDLSGLDIEKENWFAVRAVLNNGAVSQRTIAISHGGGLLNCQQENDIRMVEFTNPDRTAMLACGGFGENIGVKILNEGTEAQSNFEIAYQINSNSPVVETYTGTLMPGEEADYSFASLENIDVSGFYDFSAWVGSLNENNVSNDTIAKSISFYTESSSGLWPFSEDFETFDLPPLNWESENPENGWSYAVPFGSASGSYSICAVINNRFTTVGNEHSLITPVIDLSETGITPFLTFDIAYRERTNQQGAVLSDDLIVSLSTDCGETFPHIVYSEDGEGLATAGGANNFNFAPGNPDQWRKEGVSLFDYADNENVVLKFTSVSGGGNSLYLDNINIENLNLAPPTGSFTASSLEKCVGEIILFTGMSEGEFIDIAWDFTSAGDPMTAEDDGPHFVTFTEGGVHTVTYSVTNPAGVFSQTVEVTITAPPTASFTFSEAGFGEVTFTNTSTDGNTYDWDFGDTNSSSDESPVHIYASSGSYSVSLTVTNDCGSETFTEEIFVNYSNTQDLSLAYKTSILPNPNNGVFQVVIESTETAELQLDLMDLRGVSLETAKVKVGNGAVSQSFDASELPSGIYFLKIQSKEGIRTMKVVVE